MARFAEPGGFVRSFGLDRERVPSFRAYPFDIPALRYLDRLELHPKVTYIVGENGMGKSTLLEALAVAWGFNPEGGTVNFNFATEPSHSALHEYIRLVRGARRPRDGFFFRAESYYNVASHIEAMDREPGPGGKIIHSYGGKSLHAQSHGEAFFATFLHRFRGDGLYVLDEPEAALSPVRQMALLARMHDLVETGSQFIVSTHSPIVMAYPDSLIYYLTPDGIDARTLEETDHYIVMKEFLSNKDRMLAELLRDDSDTE
ncbi:AAA family ATPase [Paenibacillus sp.]|uniref:AAA family ATPase n=1 Tax=Paenibacillus sp. TaxID=58172 RepID=UPI002810C6F9|nr:AAA family ATPase [Paenibacillus sp.]